MKGTKYFLIVFLMVMLVGAILPSISAINWDNAIDKTHFDNSGKIKIKNWMGLGDDLVEIELLHNDNMCGVECTAIWKVDIYKNSDEFLSEIIFKDRFGNYRDIDYKFEYISGYKEITENVYETSCIDKLAINYSGSYKECSQVKTGIKTFEQPIWSEFNPYQKLKKGEYTIKLIGYKNKYESIDWIPTYYGVKADEWAWWQGNTPIAYWKLNEAIGQTLLLDSSGWYNTTLMGNAGGLTAIGKLSNSYNSTAGEAINSSSFVLGNQSFTIAIWINKTEASTNIEGIFGKSSGWIGGGEVVLGFVGNLLGTRPLMAVAEGNFLASPENISLHEWHRIVLTRDNATMNTTLYVDGAIKNSTFYGTNFTQANTVIGSAYGTAACVKCLIDDVQVYNVAWSKADVTEDWNNGVGKEAVAGSTINVSLNFPADNYQSLFSPVIFNCSAVDTNTLSGIINLTLYIDNVVRYSIKNSSANQNLSLQNSQNLNEGSHNWTCRAIESEGYVSWATSNRTLTKSTILENSQSWNSSVYETSGEGFSINFNYSASTFTSTEANLVYNTTRYAGTKSGSGNNTIYSYSLGGVPAIVRNTSFYWEIGLINSSGTVWANSSIKYQSANPILLTQCNTTSNVTYLNITFKDETALTRMNASVVSSTFNYWLGDGTTYKTLNYINLSTNVNEYDFCFSPVFKTLNNNISLGYSFTGYPQRTIKYNSALTNVTKNKTLYLLASADGIYVTFALTDAFDTIQPRADIYVERSFTGIFEHILDGATDDSGTATFWMDPDETYRLTFTKSGCTTKVYTIVPALNTYTVEAECGGGSSSEVIQTLSGGYVSYIDGISWLKSPQNGFQRAGKINFTYFVYSSKANLVGIKFDIVNVNGVVLNTTTATVAGATCTSSYCQVNLTYFTINDDSLKGKYYVKTTNFSDYVILEGDAYWKFIDYNTNATGTLHKFVINFRNLFSEWSSNATCNYPTNATCAADGNCKWVEPDNYIESLANGTCIPNDERNKEEFSRIVFFFLMFSIIYAMLNRVTGLDTSGPGLIIIFLTGFVLVGSFAGGAYGPGFFYYDGLFGHNSLPAEFLNNWIYAILLCCLSIGYFVTQGRKNS